MSNVIGFPDTIGQAADCISEIVSAIGDPLNLAATQGLLFGWVRRNAN